jgi:putative ABC transport system permease protein
MNFGEVIKVAWKSLTSNKSRSLLTMLGIIIGVAAVIIMMAISAGTEATIAESINGLGSNLIFINASFQRGGPIPGVDWCLQMWQPSVTRSRVWQGFRSNRMQM